MGNKNIKWRNGLIAKVKIGQKWLGMSDEEYRGMLDDLFGVQSCTALNIPQLEDLVAHLGNRGVEYPDAGKRFSDRDPATFYEIPAGTPHYRQKRYIAALWRKLGWKMSGIDVRCAQQFGVEKFIWLNNQRHLQTLAKDLVNRCRAKSIDTDPELAGL